MPDPWIGQKASASAWVKVDSRSQRIALSWRRRCTFCTARVPAHMILLQWLSPMACKLLHYQHPLASPWLHNLAAGRFTSWTRSRQYRLLEANGSLPLPAHSYIDSPWLCVWPCLPKRGLCTLVPSCVWFYAAGTSEQALLRWSTCPWTCGETRLPALLACNLPTLWVFARLSRTQCATYQAVWKVFSCWVALPVSHGLA